MIGFKCFEAASVTISGIELAAKIRKHQFKIGKLAGKPITAPAIWSAILAARQPHSDSKLRKSRTSQKFAPEPGCSGGLDFLLNGLLDF